MTEALLTCAHIIFVFFFLLIACTYCRKRTVKQDTDNLQHGEYKVAQQKHKNEVIEVIC